MLNSKLIFNISYKILQNYKTKGKQNSKPQNRVANFYFIDSVTSLQKYETADLCSQLNALL